jgi:type I restriction enzyme S subunit
MSATETTWRTTTLGEACEINPRKPNLNTTPDSTAVMFVPMAAVDDLTGVVEAPEIRSLGEVRKKSYTAFSSGDVLFAKITPCMENGKSAVVPEIPSGLGFGSTEFHVLRARHDVDARFVWHLIRQENFRRIAEQHMTGTVGQARVPKSFLEDFQIAIPSKQEQEAIARLLDDALQTCRAARQHLDTSRRSLQRFRRATLAAACSGRLTADWRASHDDFSGRGLAEALFASSDAVRRRRSASRDEREDLREYPETWGSALFGAVTINHDGRRVPVKSSDRARRQGPYPYYGASGVIDQIDDFLFEGDYLLVSEDGANLLARSTPIAFRASGRFWVNNHAHVVQGQPGIVDAYLEIVINGRDIQTHITGSAQPKLTQGALNALAVPVPSTAEQNEIVNRVTQLHALADHLESRVATASKRVDRSAQAILAKAFRGDLTADSGPAA